MSASPLPNLPGFGALADTMEFMRNMWSGAGTPGVGLPGMVMPTLSVEEIDKQISDLKAVESWLTLNMNMLRGTIQTLEVQSATLSALRTMGETLSASVAASQKPAAAPAAPAAPAASAAPAAPPASAAPAASTPAASSTGLFGFPFGRGLSATTPAEADPTAFVSSPAAASMFPAPPSGPADAAGSARAPSTPADRATHADERATTGSGDGLGGDTNSAAAPDATAGTAPFAAPMANPAAWWNLLQEQFKQAVNNALAPEADSSAARRSGGKSRTAREDAAGNEAPRRGVKAIASKNAVNRPASRKPVAAPAVPPAGKPASKAASKSASKPESTRGPVPAKSLAGAAAARPASAISPSSAARAVSKKTGNVPKSTAAKTRSGTGRTATKKT